MVFVTWVGWSVIGTIVVGLFCLIQWLLSGVVYGREPDFDWWDIFPGTLLLAAVVWLPMSLGWAISATGG